MIPLECTKSVIEVVGEVVVECLDAGGEVVGEVDVECLDAGGLWNIDDLDSCVECRHNTQMPAPLLSTRRAAVSDSIR